MAAQDASTQQDWTWLNGANAPYLLEIYEQYLAGEIQLDESWQAFFKNMGDTPDALRRDRQGASWSPRQTEVLGVPDRGPGTHGDGVHRRGLNGELASGTDLGGGAAVAWNQADAGSGPGRVLANRDAILASMRAQMLIRSFRIRGHLQAQLDPLGLTERPALSELDYQSYGFSQADLSKTIFLNYALGLEAATLGEVLDICRRTYCSTIGAEYMHIINPTEKNWIQERLEKIAREGQAYFTKARRLSTFTHLTQSEQFERYLDRKYPGAKRFGLDGGESAVPLMDQILRRGSELGLEEAVLGMAHRGRLNVLANVMRKPLSAIFAEFKGIQTEAEHPGSGDVKYHLGLSTDRTVGGRLVHLSLTANPSHLEAVNTVVLGKVRAKQRQRADTERNKVMAILLHGDAAFAGQGVVAETLVTSQLKGYRIGGTIHVVINNQIGFTTSPAASRSSPHCSEVAKMVEAPIFHVNGDDPEACVQVARLAVEYRYRFRKDVVIDLWCYRRHGHNESDEPKFTQPLMYNRIEKHPTTCQIYAKKLTEDHGVRSEEIQKIQADFHQSLEADFEAAETYRRNERDSFLGKWAGLRVADSEGDRRGLTCISAQMLEEIGRTIVQVPGNFKINSKLARLLAQKRQMFETGQGFDWATAEALAFGALLCESIGVRLSGEDCCRGTFSHRHAVLVDQETEETYTPLHHIRVGQAPFEVIDSPLSEFGVLGYEYGYSLAEPHCLVLWEAQFGDFANGAQVIIDQFITSGESKWQRYSGLVMLLPHGYEGQGPEHSSSRLERYLQMCGQDNIQICNLTTPANYFHALRRQQGREFRKPLVVFAPKSLLRHRRCVSEAVDFLDGSSFHRVLCDGREYQEGALLPDAEIKRVVLCSGKIYFDLLEEAEKQKRNDVYLLRLEQLYPFPAKTLSAMLRRFQKAEMIWCQEEPENMGGWHFVDRRLESALIQAKARSFKRPRYVGRAEAASPATGFVRVHREEQARIVQEALTTP